MGRKKQGDLLDNLSRSFHRLWQSSIEEELFVVVAEFVGMTKETRN